MCPNTITMLFSRVTHRVYARNSPPFTPSLALLTWRRRVVRHQSSSVKEECTTYTRIHLPSNSLTLSASSLRLCAAQEGPNNKF